MKVKELAKQITVYKLEWMLDTPRPVGDQLEQQSPDLLAGNKLAYHLEHDQHYILGELANHQIVSFPPSMPALQALQLADELSQEIAMPVLPITHNVAFVQATRLTRDECRKVLEEINAKRKASKNAD